MKKILFLTAALLGSLLAAAPALAQNPRLGYVPTEDHPVGQASRHFAKLVEEKTGGRIKIDTFGNGVLGSEPEMQSSVQAGFIDIMVGPTPNLVGVVPQFMLFDLPFFFKDFAAADAVMDGAVGEQLFAQLKEKTGIVGLAWWDNGFRHLTNAVRPVNTVEDMAGLNIRVIPNPLFIATWSALGTNPTPLPWPELYSALENRAVDGQETPYALISTARFYEVQGHLAKTGHVYTPFVLLASQKWFGSLSEEDKAIVMEAAKESATFQRQLSRKAAEDLEGELEAKGFKITRPTPEALAAMSERVAPVVKEYSDKIGVDLVEQARSAMGAK
ncbi:TRAP transporter substrate-binding protein [Phyllobacterium sp. 0TCS1.6C]|uniref:TRAP transporter substrate-binding protein n=1 Tax=unclassified Phyllobacterium TaxID=2638441 RepID=UPI0022646A0F|nr:MULTISPECIES: TRAP transporter substrate-binding protein [unclassified Phyllobacterium]MCX8278907.1 TRAP transporter substrate-binding protein [Phyllobacterium sp. 0TCS1.6C]MCX8293691.1 TRAP transporter substrate-binding protein [Phyllobacterium sp. 0TCS1.6A]